MANRTVGFRRAILDASVRHLSMIFEVFYKNTFLISGVRRDFLLNSEAGSEAPFKVDKLPKAGRKIIC